VPLITSGCEIRGPAAHAEDLKITKKITVGDNSFSSDVYVKGARERNVMNMPGGMSDAK